MANELRVRANGVAGALSAALAQAATTMTSAGLAGLPVIDATNHALLTLYTVDANGRVTKIEIVTVTAHSSGATTATVVRGQFGTSDQGWAIGDKWEHGVTAADLLETRSNLTVGAFNGLTLAEIDTGHAGIGAFLAGVALGFANSRFRADSGNNTVMNAPSGGALFLQLAAVDALYIDSTTIRLDKPLSGAVITRRKPADTARTSTTARTADPDLIFPVPASTVWNFQAFLFNTGAQAGDLSLQITGPAGASAVIGAVGIPVGSTTATLPQAVQQIAGGTALGGAISTGSISTTAPTAMVHVNGVITIAGTAGNVSIDWAQVTSSATATTLKAGSHLVATRIS